MQPKQKALRVSNLKCKEEEEEDYSEKQTKFIDPDWHFIHHNMILRNLIMIITNSGITFMILRLKSHYQKALGILALCSHKDDDFYGRTPSYILSLSKHLAAMNESRSEKFMGGISSSDELLFGECPSLLA